MEHAPENKRSAIRVSVAVPCYHIRHAREHRILVKPPCLGIQGGSKQYEVSGGADIPEKPVSARTGTCTEHRKKVVVF